MDYCAYWLPKRGNCAEECEDACAAAPAEGRFAVADGATESVFAREWAQLLVDQFVAASDCGDGDGGSWLSRVWELWLSAFRDRELKWFAQEKMRTEGANATFLGIEIEVSSGKPWHWRAVAIGDSCLFHTRDGELLEAFPIHHSEQFGTCPVLVSSRMSPERIVQKRARRTEGQAQPADRLWMMTDALARWCLAEQEGGDSPWKGMEWVLERSTTQERFSSWIEGLRDAKQIRNDDVTLLVVSL